MILISHRGNINGVNKQLENNPDYILEAIKKGFNVEVDVFLIGDQYYLGHDFPQYKINESFLENELLWCHAKNIRALDNMLKNNKIHCFWHQTDDFALTSKNIIWTYPNKDLTNNSICLILDKDLEKISIPKNILGICADDIQKIKEKL